MKHAGRAHSKFSASGAERYFECSASVEASEGQPDKDTIWSLEGTKAHEIVEAIMRVELSGHDGADVEHAKILMRAAPSEMIRYATNAASFMLGIGEREGAEVLVETRIYLDFIHKEMFGTFDGAVLDHFGTLHVFDFKYGAGHSVSPKENLQMIFYGLGLAHKHQWNFKTVRLWIIQPRIKGYDGPTYWDISIEDLKAYVKVFTEAVWRVENKPEFKEGSWCHFCKAKAVCPLKRGAKLDKAIDLFKSRPINKQGGINGNKEENQKGKDRKEKGLTKSKKEKAGKTKKAGRSEGTHDFL